MNEYEQRLLTELLASALESKLTEMGELAKGISWFSSIAGELNVH